MCVLPPRKTKRIGAQIGDLAASKRFREFRDEVYLREMNIAAGGVGCACWDAGIILANWIYENFHVFQVSIISRFVSSAVPSFLVFCSRSVHSLELATLMSRAAKYTNSGRALGCRV